MSIQTIIMNQIIPSAIDLQSPCLVCNIRLSPDSGIQSTLVRYWVEKGKGLIIILIENQHDFRTKFFVDPRSIYDELLGQISVHTKLKKVTIKDKDIMLENPTEQELIEVWSICHNAIMINNAIFKLNELEIHIWIDE